MNQRLLERLKRHGDFPQSRPTATVSRQDGSFEPFDAARPRLALSKQNVPNAQSPSGSQPLEPALPTSSTVFPEADFSQATQVESLVNATQVDSLTLEDDAAVDGSNFSEIPFADSPFALDPQTVPANTIPTITIPVNAAPINTEATIATPLSTVPGAATNLAPNANPTSNASANSTAVPTVNQLEPASRNPQRGVEPRANQDMAVQPIVAIALNALEPQTGVSVPGADTVSANTVTSAESRAIESRAIESSTAESQPQENAVFAESDADGSASSPSTSSNTLSTTPASPIDPEQPAPDFDRRAAMLELRELGVKVRVTLSNAALQAQLEAARTPASSAAATRPASITAPYGDREPSPATIEARVASNADSAPRAQSNSRAPQAQPNPSTEDAARAPTVSSSSPDRASMGANPAEAAGLESASFESGSLELVNPAQTLGAVQSRAESLDESSAPSSNTQPTSFDGSPPLGVNQPLEQIAESDVEPADYGTVVAVEVYNPPNRRAAVARPKAIEAPMNQAEVLFSTLPDSSPLEWLNRLNSVQALGSDSSSPALVGTTQSPARPGELVSPTQINAAQPNAASVSAVRANAPLLPNPGTNASPSASPLEVARSPTLAAPLSATERGSQSSPALIAPVAGSAQSAAVAPTTPTASTPTTSTPTTSTPTTSTPTAIQRRAVSDGDANASQTSNQDATATATATAREPALGNSVYGDAASERTVGQATDLEVQDYQTQDPRAQNLEVVDVETGIGSERATLEADGLESLAFEAATAAARTDTSTESSPLEGGTVVQNSVSQSIPRDAAGDSRDPASEVMPKPSAAPRDPSTSSQAASSQTSSSQASSSDQLSSTSSSSFADRGTDAIAPAATVQKLNAAAQSDPAPQNMPQQGIPQQSTSAGVEVYNPPNRRAAVARPKATEAPMNQAEVLFSTLPDSSPLEWLNRLNSVQALGSDSSNTPMLAPALLSAADAVQAAPLIASEPGLRAAPDLGTARVSPAPAIQSAAAPANTTSLTQSTARVVSEPGVRAAASTDLQRGSAPQMRALDASNAPLTAQPLVQIGSAQSSASLIATPPNATALIAEPPANPELGTESPSPARAAEQPAQLVQPVRLSSSAQRLIAPITGIDPGTVQIRRDAQSDALTKMYRADALTVNGTVLLSARLGAETPEMLGVVAHELTHVARERQPRFVPPALRQPLMAANRAESSSTASLEGQDLQGQSEESIALQVEGFARALAQQGMAVSNASAGSARPANGASVNAAGAPSKSRSLESVPWGDGVLPAPWELADRLEALANPGLTAARRQSAQPAFQQSASQQPTFQQSAAPQAAYNNASTRSDAPSFAGSSSSMSLPAAASSGGNASGIGRSSAPVSVQAADQGRSVPTPSPAGPLPKSPEAAPKPASGSAPAPDLDDLARQVYAVLKRRLITERRRSS